jgi:hypothetical protein
MGLSPGKDKKKVNAAEQRTNTSIDAVSAPDPLNDRLRAQQMKVLDWEDSTDPNKNILDMPGIGDYMDIYGSADQLAEQGMMGGGAMRLAEPASGTYQTQVKELGKNQRYDMRAHGLSDARQWLKADANQQSNQLIDRELQKRMGVANLNLGNQAQLYSRYKKQNPWYQKLWNAGLQAAQVAAKAYGGGQT